MTPQTLTQNLLYWAAALGVAVLLSFLSGLATHWPAAGPIDWRGVWLDVIQTLLTTVPIVAAGFGLPRLGKEGIASLVSEVSSGQAKTALQVEAIRQKTGVQGPTAKADDDSETLADRVWALPLAERETVATDLAARAEREMKRLGQTPPTEVKP
jgi:hypothetical protein